jgi:hypothetical protein
VAARLPDRGGTPPAKSVTTSPCGPSNSRCEGRRRRAA